jgi:ligand-binding SRPBCC domain-containing protein
MEIDLCFDIQRPIEDVFAFALDVTNLPLYEKSILEVKKISNGPIGMGTTFHLVARQLGVRMKVVLVFTSNEPYRQFSYQVDSGPFPVETHYSFENHENGTHLTGRRVPKARGVWKLLLPLAKIPARRKFFTELNGLKDYLEVHFPS